MSDWAFGVVEMLDAMSQAEALTSSAIVLAATPFILVGAAAAEELGEGIVEALEDAGDASPLGDPLLPSPHGGERYHRRPRTPRCRLGRTLLQRSLARTTYSTSRGAGPVARQNSLFRQNKRAAGRGPCPLRPDRYQPDHHRLHHRPWRRRHRHPKLGRTTYIGASRVGPAALHNHPVAQDPQVGETTSPSVSGAP